MNFKIFIQEIGGHEVAYIACSLKNGRGYIVITKFFMTKIYLNGSLERFTKFSNHKILELCGNGKKQS